MLRWEYRQGSSAEAPDLAGQQLQEGQTVFTYHITLQVEITVEANDQDDAISEALDRVTYSRPSDFDWQVEAVSSNDARH